ncbi:MAG: ATP-binding protein [Pseudomonadota bacterium]
MKLWPQSLLWRTVMLLALLIIISQLAWFFMVRWLEREPRAQQIAQQASSVVQLTRTALIAVQPAKRRFFLMELHQQEGIRIYPAFPGESAGLQPQRPFFKLVQQHIKQRLGADTQVSFGRRGVPGLWVSFKIEDDEYWVAMPRVQVARMIPLQWVMWGTLSLVLALIGAWFIASRINRPVQALAQAATKIGLGEQADPIPEQGPAELRTLTRSFNQMNADLLRLHQARTVMLAGVSHDLRTPLTRLRLAVEMLQGKVDVATQSGMVQDIEDMDAIVGQFLAFARGLESEPLETVDLNQLIEATCARYARSGKPITTELGTLPTLALRPLAMQRLLSNLLDNALNHGGTEVAIQTAHSGNAITISVLDRGPGIPTQAVDAALQPFSRLNSARSGQSGAGLGLAIVEHIARMHGGKLELLARPGGGLEARITLPTI